MNWLDFFLWFQTFYSIWQFIRTTKFLRLPYVSLASLWNGGWALTKPAQRHFVVVQGTRPLDTKHIDLPWLQQYYDFDWDDATNNLKFVYNGVQYSYLTTKRKANTLGWLLKQNLINHVAASSLQLLPDLQLVKSLNIHEAIERVLAGVSLYELDSYCIVDHTSDKYLNKNFMRLITIFPLSLQAKGYSNASTYLSLLIVLLDVCSYPANKLWAKFREGFFRNAKLLLARFPLRQRVFLHHFLATGSDSLMYCDIVLQKAYYRKYDSAIVHCEAELSVKDQITNLGEKEIQLELGTTHFSVHGRQYEVEIKSNDIAEDSYSDQSDSGLTSSYCVTLQDGRAGKHVMSYETYSTAQFVLNFFSFLEKSNSFVIRKCNLTNIHLQEPLEYIERYSIHQCVFVNFDSRVFFVSDHTLKVDEFNAMHVSRIPQPMRFRSLLNPSGHR